MVTYAAFVENAFDGRDNGRGAGAKHLEQLTPPTPPPPQPLVAITHTDTDTHTHTDTENA
jgi:hypothetical protein